MIDVRTGPAPAVAPAVLVLLDGASVPRGLLDEAARTEVAAYLDTQPPVADGDVHVLPRPGRRPAHILVSRGASTSSGARLAGAAVARALPGDAVVPVAGLSSEVVTALVEGLGLASYTFRAGTGRTARPWHVLLAGSPDVVPAAERGRQALRGAVLARDLTNTRSNVKTPAWLGQQAVAALQPLGVDVRVHDEAWLREKRFGGVLAVGGGSASPPRLIEARWRPRGARQAGHLVVVGKGITFDTGGLNIKRGEGMRSMFTDMAGGAAALGALSVIAERRLPLKVTVLVPAAENSVSGSAYRPSDVVRHYGGRTTEVLNTDAEGRMVLADAMAYAVDRLRPSALVDIATLTGAMKIALGLRTGGLLATDDGLADDLLAAAGDVDEPLWRLPLARSYDSTLSSSVADANNSPGNPGGITAALFLRPFAGDVPWAHLDVAGPARATEAGGILTPGATGFGARLLARLAERLVDR